MFLYGKAGTGKSLVINQIRKEFKDSVLITASTGKAAANI